MLALVFDTETTGLVHHSKPVLDAAQPNLVQLGAILGNPDTGKIYGRIDSIIIPNLDGYEWDIPEKVADIHGITTAEANQFGVYLPAQLEVFLDMVEVADVVVAHNVGFDLKIIEIACARCREYDVKSKDNPQFLNPWRDKPTFCTLKAAKADPSIKSTSERGTNLGSLHRQLVGHEMEGAHEAFADTSALWKIFCIMNQKLQKKGTSEAA
ncbi:3'-5' exonuclease [Candidatus Macondimonas diazotrophica]|nr:3'-5' exonuclease [Candidatus Macondimonas diazotrophica]